jgi:hypothetical protein
VAILGANSLGLALAEALRAVETPVVFIDSNPENCRRLEEKGFGVVYGNALEERTLQRGRFEGVRVAVGLTTNETVNAVFVDRARDLFAVPEGLVAVERTDTGFAKELVEGQRASVAFDGPHDVGRWEVRARRGSVTIEKRCFRPPDEAPPPADAPTTGDALSGAFEGFVVIAVQRGGRVAPMSQTSNSR